MLRDERKIAELSQGWGEALASWAVPDELLAKSPTSPYRLNPDKFKPDQSRRSSGTVRELERLATDQKRAPRSLIDVGSAAGGISLLVAASFEKIVAVDQSKEMLDAFEENATALGFAERIRTVNSAWPTTLSLTADIVLNANVLYNVPNPAPFVAALIDAATQSVVIEVTRNHPLSNVNALYEHFHHIKRPTTPTANDVIELVKAFGYSPKIESWIRTTSGPSHTSQERLNEYQSRACIEENRREELREYLNGHELPPMEVVMISFDK
ncbi:MAG: methyltransferase domain-containing protein [Actinomycetota bacterium]|nr:methyltransferase domain-containing protein [Actinomycetota bacterium]